MADPDSNAADIKEVSAQDIQTMTARASSGNDNDLPANQRRNRATPITDRNGTILSVGDTVSLVYMDGSSTPMTVLGHGRGIGWLLCGFIENNNKCIGTYPVGMIIKKKA